MRAIETRYKGRLFRSRLEARYAVLFDALAIPAWEYEPEGFILDSGLRYLPDFWLPIDGEPGSGYWIEVKPVPPAGAEVQKLEGLVLESGHEGWFLIGQPGDGSALRIGGQADNQRWAAPLLRCSKGPISDAVWRRAVAAALSARFEFAARERA